MPSWRGQLGVHNEVVTMTAAVYHDVGGDAGRYRVCPSGRFPFVVWCKRAIICYVCGKRG